MDTIRFDRDKSTRTTSLIFTSPILIPPIATCIHIGPDRGKRRRKYNPRARGARALAGREPSGKLLRMPRTKTFSIKMADLPNMVDAIFAGNHDDPGWIEMSANDKGRA
jgi:hypothetical protein